MTLLTWILLGLGWLAIAAVVAALLGAVIRRFQGGDDE